MTATAERPPAPAAAQGQLSHREILVVLSGLLLGMFLASLDQTIVSTAMRTIADELNGQTAQAWVTTAYLITSTISTPLYGKLSDSYGRKPFYVFAIVVFLVGSLLCGTATDIYQLAAYRAVQGIGAGGLMSLAFAIVGDLVSPRERGRYQAYFMSVFGTSSVLGPVLGGALAGQDTLLGTDGWRWIFYVNVPIGLAALVVVSKKLTLPRRRSPHPIDFFGAVLLTTAVVPVLLLAEKGREWGWASGLSLGMVALSVVSLALFVPWQARMREAAILPLRMFRNTVFTVSSGTAMLVGAGMFGALVGPAALPADRQGAVADRGRPHADPAHGRDHGHVRRHRPGHDADRPLQGLPDHRDRGDVHRQHAVLHARRRLPVWHAMVFMVVMGAGLGLSMQTLVLSVQNALPPPDMGVATSSVTFFRSIGGTFGAAVVAGPAVQLGHRQHPGARPGGRAAAGGDRPVRGVRRASTTPRSSRRCRRWSRRVVLQGFADSMSHTFFVDEPAADPGVRPQPVHQGGPAADHRRAGAHAQGRRRRGRPVGRPRRERRPVGGTPQRGGQGRSGVLPVGASEGDHAGAAGDVAPSQGTLAA